MLGLGLGLGLGWVSVAPDEHCDSPEVVQPIGGVKEVDEALSEEMSHTTGGVSVRIRVRVGVGVRIRVRVRVRVMGIRVRVKESTYCMGGGMLLRMNGTRSSHTERMEHRPLSPSGPANLSV